MFQNGNRASVETERSGVNGEDEHATSAEGDECTAYRKDSNSQEGQKFLCNH